MSYLISSIQQVGIGIPDVEAAWHWYRTRLGIDIPIFREAAEAPLMTPYTGGEVQSRDAILAINLRGGGGFEIWQYTSRKTVFPETEPRLGDTGIYATVVKAEDVQFVHRFLLNNGCSVLCKPIPHPTGKEVFYLSDPWGNIFQVAASDEWFVKKGSPNGGVTGAVIGVSDMESALKLYSECLEFDVVSSDETGVFPDWSTLPGGSEQFRRVCLRRSSPPSGPFAPIFGSCTIELVQALERTPAKIFQNRYWGDAGFIHLCFDVQGMDALGEKLKSAGFPFTIDSQTPFDMGEAAGRFTYIEDADGTLIEFVETWKLPVIKKCGWYIDLSNRPMGKPLPKFILKALGLGRVRN